MALFTFTKTNTVKKSTGFFAKLSQTAKLRRAENALTRMNDRLLEDIGMSRGDVHGKVWGEF